MGGGLMQLVAYGAQDIYLTGNPQITFFKVVYRRHTNFSVESIEQTFNGTAAFSKKVSATIARNGDLIHRVLLEVNLGTLTGNTAGTNGVCFGNYLGERLLKYIDVEIGGQRIDRHYGEWLHIWSQLTLPESQVKGYNNMIGHTPSNVVTTTVAAGIASQKLFIPLQFWFCRNPGLALPLIALQYHEVKINIEFADLADVALEYANNGNAQGQLTTPVNSMESASLWVDYVYLDTDERRRFAQLSHEYLIEQLQYPGEETISVTSNKIKLAFNHPVKEIIWVVQNTSIKDTAKQLFNYTTATNPTPLFTDHSTGNSILSLVDIATGGTTAISAGALDTGINNVKKAKLQLNGQDRFAERDGAYFNLVIPYYHHTRTPNPGINVYSFGLKPEEHQPSGTCNFSRIDNANLFLTVDSSTLNSFTAVGSNASVITTSGAGTNATAKVRVYAVNYNVLRVMSGMGGLAYSN